MIGDADTERMQLVYLAAQNAAEFYYRLKAPEVYRHTHIVNLHRVYVIITDDQAEAERVVNGLRISGGG